MARILLSVGQSHGIRPGDIVGAIANEAGVPGKIIGQRNPDALQYSGKFKLPFF